MPHNRNKKSSRDLPAEPGLPQGVVRSVPTGEPSPPVPLPHAVGEGVRPGLGVEKDPGGGRRSARLIPPSPTAWGRGTGGEGREDKITAIEPQQRREGRVNVYIDGKFAIGLFEEIAQSLGLRVGQAITPERLEEISRAETLRRAREDAYTLLSYRDRSEKEIADRLARKGYEEEVIAEVTAHLETVGYVDDARFAERWAATRGGTHGRRAIAHELRAKGVAEEVVREALQEAVSDDGEQDAALTAAIKRVGERPADTSRPAQARLSAFLARRGFGWDVIRPVLARLYGNAAPEESEAEEGT